MYLSNLIVNVEKAIVTGNSVTNCQRGLYIWAGVAEVQGNVFYRNNYNIFILNRMNGYKSVFNNNDIIDNSKYDIYPYNSGTSNEINAKGNYWGEKETNKIYRSDLVLIINPLLTAVCPMKIRPNSKVCIPCCSRSKLCKTKSLRLEKAVYYDGNCYNKCPSGYYSY